MSKRVAVKDPDVDATYEIDVFDNFVLEADRSTWFGVLDVVRAPRETGYLYECTKAGRSRANYPDFPRAANITFQDGSAEFVSRDPADVTIVTIDTVVWTVPTGLTLVSQSETDDVATVTLSGGAAGSEYEVTARITPTSGDPRELTLIVPVGDQ